jgi:hypothetical protein
MSDNLINLILLEYIGRGENIHSYQLSPSKNIRNTFPPVDSDGLMGEMSGSDEWLYGLPHRSGWVRIWDEKAAKCR